MKQNNLNGSICLTDLAEFIKANPQLKQKAKNGKDYLNVNIFFKDAPDQYGNVASITLKKLEKDEPTKYLGNLKEYTPQVEPSKAVATANSLASNDDDLPF